MKISEIRNAKETDRLGVCIFSAILKSIQIRKTKNGGEFIMADFGDNSGTLSAMCFDSASAFETLRVAQAGDIFEVTADIEFYQGRLSPKILATRQLSKEESDAIFADLAECSPYNPEEMKAELFSIIETISDSVMKKTVLTALADIGDNFFTSTAAVKMHHAYVYGLLEHTLKCARMALALLPLYPFIDRDLSIAGVILHDIGKVLEYTQSLAVDKTRIGILQGHVVLGYRLVRRAALKSGLDSLLTERLEHIILSHQGELEWGAAAKAATPEAVFVSSIDNFDAKLGAVEAAIRSSEGAEFVEVGALRMKVLATPPLYPEKEIQE